MSSYYDFSGYCLDSGHPRDTITTDTKPKPEASKTSMENFLNDAWSTLSEAFIKLEFAQKAQEEDDKAGEELDRSKEQFVERIRNLQTMVGRVQSGIMEIIYEHNHR